MYWMKAEMCIRDSYKLDYNKVLEYHIEKKADITVVCKDMEEGTDVTRFGCVKLRCV